MSPSRLPPITVQAIALTVLGSVNVWLAVANVRWIMFYYPVSRYIPTVDLSSGSDPILEVPGILVGILVAYFLMYRQIYNVWQIRFSIFREVIMLRVLSINSTVLIVLTALGISQWLLLYKRVPIDLYGLVFAGGVAIVTASYLESRMQRHSWD